MPHLPNLALQDQGAPPLAARVPVALRPPGLPGTPASRSAPGRAPGGAPRPCCCGQRRRAGASAEQPTTSTRP
jgi:hypothetical protein